MKTRGRPKNAISTVKITARVEPSTRSKLKTYAKTHHQSLGQAVDDIAKKASKE